jgi:polar amino acid transport system substrate-binding protein
MRKAVWVVLTVLSVSGLIRGGTAAADLGLTPQEIRYLEKHPVLRVHNETDWPPFNFNINGVPKGFAIEYIQMLAEKLGVKLEYVTGYSWDDFVKLLSTPELDLLLNASITPERRKIMTFTRPYLDAKNAIYTNVRKEAYYSLDELAGKKVALVRGFFIQKFLAKHRPGIEQVLVDSLPEALELLSFGKVDAVIGKQVVVDYVLRQRLFSNILATDYLHDPRTVSHLAIAADKNDSVLISILDKAQKHLDPLRVDRLKHRWFGINVLLNTREVLTDKEKEYLSEKKRIAVCYHADHFPVESEGEQGPEGIAIDVIQTVLRRLKVNALYVPVDSRKEAYDLLRQHRCEVLAAASKSDTENGEVLFTRPYLNYSVVIVAGKGAPEVTSLDQLRRHVYVAWEGNPIMAQLLGRFPHMVVLLKSNPKKALEAIRSGEAYFTVLPEAIFRFFQNKEGFDDLKVIGRAPIQGNLSLAVSKNAPELFSILNKVLKAIPAEAYRAISDKWIESAIIRKTDYIAMLQIVGIALLVIGAILLAYRRQARLKRHIEELNASLESRIEEALEKNKEQQIMMLHQDRHARMGEMISMIAHQWRQPLNNLALVNQLLLSKYDKGKLDDEAVAYFRSHSKRLIEQMSDTIEDFRNFYKVEKETSTFCVGDVIRELIDHTHVLFEKNGVHVDLDIEGCSMFVGYPNEFKHAVLNIMSNAREALVEQQNTHKTIAVEVFETLDRSEIIVRITDNAGGIPPEIRDKIFEPYFSTKEEKNGTGLGLYMARVIIVDHMHSHLEAEDVEGGTAFVIRLVRNPDELDSSADDSESPAASE